MLTQEERRKKIGDVLRVASGNFLEQYDFFVYGYDAFYIGKTFFPADNAIVSLMLSLATFAVGFFMRPLGAIILGSYIDRHGRRKGLLVTLGLMAAGTLSIAITPGYETLGILAPLIILAGRLLQGFSAGAELGGVSIYLAEIATPGRRGFYTSWQSASQQPAVVVAALIGAALSAMLTTEQMTAWGWRIPLLIGCAIIPVILFLRQSLAETEEFQKMKHAHSGAEVLRIIAENWRIVLTGAGMSVLTTTIFYLITAYTPTFGREALHLDTTGVLIVTLCVGISNFIWLPIGGHISDRIGRYPLLLLIPVLAILTAYPGMNWLADAPSFPKLLTTVLLFSSYFGLYNGAMIPTLAEIMPARVRTAGFSLAFSLATALFGGLTPLVSTALIHQTGDRAAPALWLTFAALVSLGSVILSRRKAKAPEGAPALS
ncbi:MFS transporter [Methylobacterium sp. E-065]|uniref:MFS transporter n=1 Tax=Methylobacterium sp. E-065 TaxID=2836583 RepID=UPI002444E427|nr:MFS transporter [Methylobacterium sp. E-065]